MKRRRIIIIGETLVVAFIVPEEKMKREKEEDKNNRIRTARCYKETQRKRGIEEDSSGHGCVGVLCVTDPAYCRV